MRTSMSRHFRERSGETPWASPWAAVHVSHSSPLKTVSQSCSISVSTLIIFSIRMAKCSPSQLFARKENYQFEQYLFKRPCSLWTITDKETAHDSHALWSQVMDEWQLAYSNELHLGKEKKIPPSFILWNPQKILLHQNNVIKIEPIKDPKQKLPTIT